MEASTRVVVNTAAQYARTALTVIITLFTSRWVLEYLGISDFGIFTLVASVLTMLAFIQTNLARSTQRFLSFYHGRGDTDMVKTLFNNSVVTQLAVSVVLCGTLFAVGPWLFESGIFSIAPSQREAAQMVFNVALVSLFFNLQSAPYLAVLIARENIVYSSIVQGIDTLLKIPIALSLVLFASNRLLWYAGMTAGLSVLNFACYYIFCKIRYEECRRVSLSSFSWSVTREMVSFMGWSIYGTGCIAARNQGVQIILNHFYTTAINAAYGMGLQVVNQITFLATSLTNAINPQIIKAEGASDRSRMVRLAETSCKFSFLLLGVIVVPICCNMDDVLHIWLKVVPDHTGLFCTALLISTLIDSTTLNLTTANAAIGNIRTYTVVTNTVKLITLPLVWLCLINGGDPFLVMLIYISVELIGALIRLVFMHYNIGLSLSGYLRNVIIPELSVTLINIAVCLPLSRMVQGWGFIFTVLASLLITGFASWFLALSRNEREVLQNMKHKITKKLSKS